jgi:hypothetical protein
MSHNSLMTKQTIAKLIPSRNPNVSHYVTLPTNKCTSNHQTKVLVSIFAILRKMSKKKIGLMLGTT